jgi:hypothetical protein
MINPLERGACSRPRLSPPPGARCFKLNRVHVPLHLTNKSNCCSDLINADARIGVWKLKQNAKPNPSKGKRSKDQPSTSPCPTQNHDRVIHTNFSKPHLTPFIGYRKECSLSSDNLRMLRGLNLTLPKRRSSFLPGNQQYNNRLNTLLRHPVRPLAFTDDRRWDAAHTALPGMRPLPVSI